MSSGHALILEQMDGPLEMRLEGPSVPEEFLEEEKKLKYVKRYYPGNPVPTTQILNRERLPLRFRGMFSDRETGGAGIRGRVERAKVEVAGEGAFRGFLRDGLRGVKCRRAGRRGGLGGGFRRR